MRNTLSSSFRIALRLAALLVLFSLSWNASYSQESKRSPRDVPALTPVNDWLYRGSQPQEGDFELIKKKGIQTVISFRDEKSLIKEEKEKVEALGMKYVSIPWNIWRPARPETLDQLFEVLDDSENRPVLMHCKHGRDRTGVMTTLALMRYDKLSEAEAREMALELIRPNLRYHYLVDRKINSFVKYMQEKEARKGSGERAPSPAVA